MQILDALERFLLQLEANGRSSHTIGQYRRHVRQLAAWAATAGLSGEIEEIEPQALAGFLAAPVARMTDKGREKKATSVNALRGSMRGFFGFLNSSGALVTDPSRLLRPAITSPPPPRAIQPAEQEKLMAVLVTATGPEARRDHLMVELMLATGVRLSSTLAIDVGDVALDEGVLHLRQVKGDRVERVFLAEQIRDLLAEYIGDRTAGPLFPGRGGERLSARHVQRRFRMWRVKAGVAAAVTPHSLRHAFAMRLYEKTGDVLLVKRALGHRSIASTLVYARVTDARLREAMSA